ncbi:hypothetical protein BH18THE2_BH18THE2_03470 [soil metagenome]
MNSIANEQTVENIIQTLIALPEFLRKSVLEGRIKEFFSLGAQDKHEIVLGVLQSISSFEEKKISVLVKTWLEVLSNFDAAQIVEMLRLYCQEIRNDPVIIQRIPVRAITNVFYVVEETKKQKLADCLKETILSFPDKDRIINLIPEEGLDVLGMK